MAVAEEVEEEGGSGSSGSSGSSGAAALLERRADGPLVWNERHISVDWASGPMSCPTCECECAVLVTPPDDDGLWRIART